MMPCDRQDASVPRQTQGYVPFDAAEARRVSISLDVRPFF